ncbi:Emc6 [Scenedesmus sp. PABB004]|nr:Emc6 [Scenedesmus sp. PABB004]
MSGRGRGAPPPPPAVGGGDAARRRAAAEKQRAAAVAAALQGPVVQVPAAFKNNLGVVYYLRIYVTIVAGAAAGIAGLEGWGGFLVYLASQLAATAPLLAKCGGDYRKYFTSWDKVALEHVFSSTAILSYILLWMLFFNVCHVF